MKVEKDGIVKDVTENLVADYKSAGWKIYDKKDNKSKKVEIKDKEIDGE